MARVIIQVTVEREVNDGCDGCYMKDQTARESVVEFTLDGKTWYLCEEHERKFAQQFVSLLGDPNQEGEDSE